MRMYCVLLLQTLINDIHIANCVKLLESNTKVSISEANEIELLAANVIYHT